jgi:hypothetical protein
VISAKTKKLAQANKHTPRLLAFATALAAALALGFALAFTGITCTLAKTYTKTCWN